MSDPHDPPAEVPESPGQDAPEKPLYSQQVKMRIQKSERLKRNVLEINLENEKNAEEINDETVAELFKNIGINMTEVEGRQLVPKRIPRKLYVWFKEGVNIHKFCREECYRLARGVKTGAIKPMEKKDVEVTVRGLNLNTPDTMVMEYLGLFGKLVKNVAVYVKIQEGPLAGLKNGDRKYMMDFSDGRNLGTYHLIDGANTHISYAGQRRTCARCHRTPAACPGSGIARTCEERGGLKTGLKEYMEKLWEEIGYKPAEFSREIGEDDTESEDVEIRENEGFTPPYKNRPDMSETDRKNLTGISVRNLPSDLAEDQCQAFLEAHGVPANHSDIKINRLKYSTTVDVEQLDADTCLMILENIKDITIFEKKIYAKGIASLNRKSEEVETENLENEQAKAKPAVSPPPVKKIIPGLTISKTADKKLKEKKKEALKKQAIEDDFIFDGNLTDHPLYNAQKTKVEKSKKRDAALAALSPPDKALANKSKIKM